MKLKAKIESNYKADMAAVSQLLAYDDKRREASAKLANFVESSAPKKHTDEIIEELIKSYGGVFSTDDIYFKLRDAIRKTPSIRQARQISKVINRLRQRDPKEIEEIEKGKGSRSGKYIYIKK